jgi:calnexin
VYDGVWAAEEPHVLKGIEGDMGLVVKNAAKHHAISAKFPKKIDNKGKTLVVQYEVKLQSESWFFPSVIDISDLGQC